MSDLEIIGLGILVVFLAVIRVGWLAGRKLSEPSRAPDRADKDYDNWAEMDKIIEDRVNAALARRDAR